MVQPIPKHSWAPAWLQVPMPEGSASEAPVIKRKRVTKTVVYLACGRFISFSCHRFPRWLLQQRSRPEGRLLVRYFRFLFISCAISRWCCNAGRVLPAQSFSFGSSPPLAYRSKRDVASLCALTCIGSYSAAKSAGLVSFSLSSFFCAESSTAVG